MERGQKAYEAYWAAFDRNHEWAVDPSDWRHWNKVNAKGRKQWAAVEAACVPDADAEFKNFHRMLCERFNYAHDERDWKRDQVSLMEWIAKLVEAACVPAMPDDVAALVERLERPFVGTYADGTPLTIKPTEVDLLAASAIKAQAAEIATIEEQRDYWRKAFWQERARAEAAEAKLREAVEVMRLSHEVLHQLTAIIPGNDSALADTTHAMARLRAILSAIGETRDA